MPRISNPSSSEKPAIVFHNVSKSFKIKHNRSFKQAFISKIKGKAGSDDFNAVDHINLEVPAGQSIAIMGRNGSGKSTTLKLLSGVMEPDTGWIRTRGRMAGLLEVGAGFHPDLTGRQNVYLNAAILGMDKEETDARFDEILEFSEIGRFIDTEVKRYSSGMYSRLGFSVAVHMEVDTLLVDEILSVGDAQFRKKCEERMLQLREQGKTMFVVSHNANQLKKLCDRGVVLDAGKVVFDGPIDEAVEALNSGGNAKPRFESAGSIREVYERDTRQYGAPTSEEVSVTENGGGSFQMFEHGIITSFNAPDGSVRTVGLTRGIFLAAYLKRSGPAGEWGFLDGKPHGNLEDYEPRSLQFSNGTATYTIDDGMSFTTRP